MDSEAKNTSKSTNALKKPCGDAAMGIKEKCVPCAESAAVELDQTGLPCLLLLRAGLSGCCCSCCCSPSRLCCLPSNWSPPIVQKQKGEQLQTSVLALDAQISLYL